MTTNIVDENTLRFDHFEESLLENQTAIILSNNPGN